jgi:hypothetical protein
MAPVTLPPKDIGIHPLTNISIPQFDQNNNHNIKTLAIQSHMV